MTMPDRYRTLDVPVTGGSLRAGIWEAETPEPVGTLLAIHGISGTHLTWQWLVQQLPDWRIIAPDLRGRGRSNHLAEPYGMVSHASDLVAVLDAAGVTDPIPVVGHSMGGYVTAVLAHRHPDRVRRLILVDGGIPVQLPDGVAPEDAVTAVIGPIAERLKIEFTSHEQAAKLWQRHPGLKGEWGPELAAYSAYDLVGEPPRLRPSTSYAALAEDSRDIQLGEALARALAELAHPAIFLRAERGLLNQPGGLFAAEWVAQWAPHLPGLEVRDIPDSNHFTIVMSPAGSAAIAAVVNGR